MWVILHVFSTIGFFDKKQIKKNNVTLENPFTVNVLPHIPGKAAKLVCLAG
jgi:hypothetical protein